ncbi:MAG TPA: HPr(Ser) kinase/phosphatase [Candidatus Hydrogenedens sp.]|nr:HPr(Ser) kinase/phosphatase [Candidatus Hydrogenedens sp.]HOL19993.1 HPr(Ser) kinase/phosphatase [Candidatus Hydrogenedens sp.]HPP59158.1 HPr(Ser) kinase/phosphatase [Candidatus Hydrogenedens sp.]
MWETDLEINFRKKTSIPVASLFQEPIRSELGLKIIAGYQGIRREVFTPDVNRPGLALTGYLEYFANDRVQVLGNTEIHYLERLTPSEIENRLLYMFSFEIPAFLLSRSLIPPQVFLDLCNRHGVPVIQSSLTTDQVISKVILFFAEKFAPETTIHGTVVDCYGIGVVIVGASGIGKSETALELVERGHRLIVDDVVLLRKGIEDIIIAESDPQIEHNIHIRGIGMVDVLSVYGAGRIRRRKQVGLIIELVTTMDDDIDMLINVWPKKQILGVNVPYLKVPVGPGRNLAVIVEAAALKCRMMELGIDIDQQFSERTKQATTKNLYQIR